MVPHPLGDKGENIAERTGRQWQGGQTGRGLALPQSPGNRNQSQLLPSC